MTNNWKVLKNKVNTQISKSEISYNSKTPILIKFKNYFSFN